MTTFTKSCPKPVRDNADYKEKALRYASKIATIEGRCKYPGCKRTRSTGWDIVSHHIWFRKYQNVFADPLNLFPCCVMHHSVIHSNTTVFHEWFDLEYPGLRDSLWQKARVISRIDFSDVYAELLERYLKLYEEMGEKEK